MNKGIKGFIDMTRKPYKDMILGNPCIYIGSYHEDGGIDGEFKIEWDDTGIRLMAYNDSWKSFSEMPELIGLMAEIDDEKSEPTAEEFTQKLKGIGFREITEMEGREE